MIIKYNRWRALIGKLPWSINGEFLGELNMVRHNPDYQDSDKHLSGSWTGQGSSYKTELKLGWRDDVLEWCSDQPILTTHLEDYTYWPALPWKVNSRKGSRFVNPSYKPPCLWVRHKKQAMLFKLMFSGRNGHP